MLIHFFSFGAAPTVPASNLTFNNLDGKSFAGNFTAGNGAIRIVVVKQGSPVTGSPANGVDYNANSNFGTVGSEFTAPGEYVVARTSWGSFSVSNLQPGTIYYVAVFEFNGTGAATQYLMLPLTGQQSTVVAPTTQSSGMVATAITGNSMNLGWVKGNGTGRIVLARKGAPVDADPNDLTGYWADENFGSGTKIGASNYVIYKGLYNGFTLKNLEPNTNYHFAVYEYNGSATPVHLRPAHTFSATTTVGPTVAPSSPGFSWVDGNRFNFGVTIGNGSRRLFIARKGSPVTAVPVNGVVYTANAVFGTPGTEIAPGEYVVAAGSGSGVGVTNLEPNTTYHFRVFEYDQDLTNNTYYLTSSFVTKSGSTATVPTTLVSNFNMVSLTGSSATISFTVGNGSYRTVIMKAGSPVDAVPTNLVAYTGNTTFGSGAQLGSGNYVVHGTMNGAQFPVSGLMPGTTYHVSVYEYNGISFPVYSTAGATYSFTVPLEPTLAATSPATHSRDGGALRLVWSSGNGGKRIVIARKGSAVTAKPTDQIDYPANTNFGQGTQLAPGEYVVYNGAGHYFDMTGLEPGTTYHCAVYEYNVGPDGKPDYLTTSWLAFNSSTVGAPTTQTVITSTSGIQATQANFHFTSGNGVSRLFIMRQGAPVNVTPQDMVKYTYNGNFGTASAHISDGNYVVAIKSDGWPFTVYNLQANTTYHIAAFEYNGSEQPVYLRTSPGTYSFTTTDVPGATTPTTAATNGTVNAIDGNKFTFKWTNGNGQSRLVVARKGSPVNFVPANGVHYSASNTFGSNTDLGGGQYVVFNGAGNEVEVKNLEPSTTYHFTVYEYDGTTTMIRYLTSSTLIFAASTATPPTNAVNNVQATAGVSQLTLNWANGNGAGRIVVLKEGSAVTAMPADLSVYPANAVFKNGSQIALGEYVVYAGTGSSVTITGLSNKTYHYAIFEYNGINAPVYNTTIVTTGSASITAVLPVRLLTFTAEAQEAGVVLKWSTAQEWNNHSFEIERSSNGSTYKAIATIAGAGNSNSTIHYSYTDRNAPEGKLYYRLKQVDLDGRFTYSSVQPAERKRSLILQAYPNPVRSQLSLTWIGTSSRAVVKVFDAKGLLIENQVMVKGQLLNVSKWSTGVYVVQADISGQLYRQTIIKQ